MKKVGIVISIKKNTVSVLVRETINVKKYKNFLFRYKKYLITPFNFKLKLGDVVVLKQTRRLSPKKNFTIINCL